MHNFIKRQASEAIMRYQQTFPVVGVTGPRQSGKTTLLKSLFPDYQYVTFDDFRNIDYLKDDPIGFMKLYDNRVIFDEVQFVPEIFNLIKIAVDNDRDNTGKFLLTGSSQFSYLQKASESLAGRMGLLQLLPLQYSETKEFDHLSSIYQGSYPELVTRDFENSDIWYASYIDTYLNKDIRALTDIGDLRDFRRLLNLLAVNIGNLLEYSEYAKDIGVSVPTIKRWISVLEASYIIFLVPPFYENFGKRITKSPKLYFVDTGIVSFLSGIKTYEQYDKGPLARALFENYIMSEVYKKHLHQSDFAELYYLRTSDKAEIDLIVDFKNHRHLVEIKKSSTFKQNYVSTIKEFLSKDDSGFLLYNGDEYPYGSNIEIINYKDYLDN